MGTLRQQERAGIEAVARHFSATWQADGDGARLRVDGRPVAVTPVAIAGKGGAPGTVPRLRFDRVVVDLLGQLRSALDERVPAGQTVMITMTAPILQPGKTAAALTQAIGARIAGRARRIRIDETLYGNRIRTHLARDVPADAPRVMVFVHNPSPLAGLPAVLFALTSALLALAKAPPTRRKPQGAAPGRWLVLIPEGGSAHPATLRHILEDLGLTGRFERILLVRGRGRIDALAG